ncbi:MAG TPA: hypothetical protein VK781_04265 [Solirubrobacteraceae bacterium]|jgi:hypothetical protein|nr:hypothetical protein [Solirubrobacteraceae bacterium]
MSPQSIALWCAIPLAIGVAIDSLELVADRAQLQEGGLYGYAVLATGRPMTLWGPFAPLFGAVFRYPAVLGLAGAQLLGATCLLLAATMRTPALIAPAGLACLLIMASRMLLYVRNQLGLDGADQMTLVVCTGLSVALLVPDYGAQLLAIDYVAAQLLLSYAVAGIAKAVSPVWRSGRAVPGIMSTIGYGSPAVGGFLKRNPTLAKAACWSVILFECSAPLMILLGTPGALVIVAVGLGFHVSIAVLMGLNNFVWSFGAAYPALFLLAHSIDTLWH